MKKIICFALALALFSACADNGKEGARRILTEAQGQYDKGNYKESLRLVDSLRRSHPEAVEERRQALTLYQDASEKLAQSEIARLDMQLQTAQCRLDSMAAVVDSHSGSNGDAALDKLARLRQQRDSLQMAFDTQCAMVRLIREKRKG